MLLAIPSFFLPRQVLFSLAKSWSHSMIWMLRVFCNIRVEYRGLDKIPKGPLLVAAKHQSAFETIALLPLFRAAAVHPQARADLDSAVRPVPAEGADDPGQSRRGRTHHVEDDVAGARAGAGRSAADHLPGRHAPAGGRGAALQVRRGADLCRLRRASACRWRSIPDCSGRAGRSCAIRERSSSSSSTLFRPACRATNFSRAPATSIETTTKRLVERRPARAGRLIGDLAPLDEPVAERLISSYARSFAAFRSVSSILLCQPGPFDR